MIAATSDSHITTTNFNHRGTFMTCLAEPFRSATRSSEEGVSDADESAEDGRLSTLRCGGWFGFFVHVQGRELLDSADFEKTWFILMSFVVFIIPFRTDTSVGGESVVTFEELVVHPEKSTRSGDNRILVFMF
jgi:hypothetical protein